MKFKVGDSVKVIADPNNLKPSARKCCGAVFTVIETHNWHGATWYWIRGRDDLWMCNEEWLQHVCLEDKKSTPKSNLDALQLV